MKESNLYNRRSRHHDYLKPFIYHIIIKKSDSAPNFGVLRGDATIPLGQRGAAYIFLSPLGKSISDGLKSFTSRFPIFQKFRHKIMPDHIHIILYKSEWSILHLNWYIDRLKECFLEGYNTANPNPLTPEQTFLFGYTDKPLYDRVNLDSWFVYLEENPHRLLMIKQFPDFFDRKRGVKIAGRNLEVYGNIFLLKNPAKFAVRIRRKFSASEKLAHYEYALEMGAKSTILISPFISPDEKKIRYAAEETGAKIILITHQKFEERYKPAKHDFDLCSQGRLLIISLGMDAKTPVSYKIATEMNELAAFIASPGFDTRLLPI